MQRLQAKRDVAVAVADVGEEIERGKHEEEFVGVRLPRSLQEWLAREEGGGRG